VAGFSCVDILPVTDEPRADPIAAQPPIEVAIASEAPRTIRHFAILALLTNKYTTFLLQ